MSSTLDRLRSLATTVAGALPSGQQLAALSPSELAEAATVLARIRSSIGDAISLVAADIERLSARDLGTEGLAQRNGHADATGFLQDLAGVGRGEAARLIRVGGLLQTAEAVAPGEIETDAGERSLDVLRRLPGGWESPVAVAVRNGWLTSAQGDALRQALAAPRRAELESAWETQHCR